jgi:hypothetical protein
MKEYIIKDKTFVFDELTCEQMELVSEALKDTRKKLFEEAVEWDMKQASKIVQSVSEMLNHIRSEGKLATLISCLLVEKGKEFSKTEADNNMPLFKQMPYTMAEDVFCFFLTSGTLSKVLIPSFLIPAQDPAASPQSVPTIT